MADEKTRKLQLLGPFGSSAVKPDMAQNDPNQPDYIKNRTHWEENSQTVIEWDGNTDGRESFFLIDRTYYKISDSRPTAEEIAAAVIELSDGNTLAVTSDMFTGFNKGMAKIGDYLYVIDESTYTGDGDLSIAYSDGIYACVIDGVYPSKFIYNSTAVYPLADKFIPNTIARKKDIGSAGLPVPATAAVGQFIVVSAVDDNGKVTATDAVTLADAEGVAF